MKNVNRGLSGEENMVGMVLGKTMDSVGGVVGGWKNETGGNVTVMTVGKEDLLIEERQAK